ncbi:MAG: thioredoxin domain-containing protein, partial [Planctomycetes bacterium]|nr:thioredoxin domain-containing protein [Planctomycetota bacterium]
MSSPGARPNRLIDETSPYLLQHARNPVEWFPWGEEAIAKSRELDRPIFLSIGYSACHWCHVMEHESFEDSGIAAYMNEHFVCVKVDREERPDLDQIYMTSVQLMTGRGGWPMSVFLTPNLKPFYGGTYWPPRARMQMPGFFDILTSVQRAWVEKRDDVFAQSKHLTEAIGQHAGIRGEPTTLDEDILKGAMDDLLQAADRTNGGFGGAPKFPHPMDIRVLLRSWKRFGNQDALDVVTLTLDKMSRGGIYDHLGGGFHRYSTDGHWLAPHFEKMLYDNALLVPAYLEGFQATGNEDYLRVVRETLDYVLAEMTQPEGGFYATQDADSEGEEGKFFVWSEAEITELLGSDDARILGEAYDVSAHGNWEGKTILNRPKPHDEVAKLLEMTPEDLEAILARCRKSLFEARAKRIAPGRDDKVLVSWNGLMISAMAQAGSVLAEEKYITAARSAVDFILSNMRDEDGRLLHSFKDGRARFNGYLDDYVCLIDGLIDLYQATFDESLITCAVELANRVFDQFGDETGGFFYTSSDHEELITRSKDGQDNAVPSGNGMAAYALLRLARLTSDARIEDQAEQTLDAISGQMQRLAMASGQALLALDFWFGPSNELVLPGGSPEDRTAAAT